MSTSVHYPRILEVALACSLLGLAGSANAQTSVSLSLDAASGWNLLGNGLANAIPVATAFGDSSKVTSVWKWLPATSTWAFYTPLMTSADLATYATSKGYSVLNSISPGEGFWVNASGAITYAHAGAPRVLSAGDLGAGWSLAATGDQVRPTDFNRALSRAGATDPIPDNLTTLWSWNSADQKWYFYAPSLERNNSLADYIASKGHLDFGARALSRSEGFWANLPKEIGFGDASGQASAPLGSGSYSIAYASSTSTGIDYRSTVTATIGNRGELTGYVFSTQEQPTIGLMSAADVAGDADINIGRWNGGRMRPFYFSVPGYTERQGFHYAIGLRDQTTAPVCGERIYRLVSATAPTRGDGGVAPGALATGGNIRLAFGPVKKVFNGSSLADTNTTRAEVNLSAVVDGATIPLGSTGTAPASWSNGYFAPAGAANFRGFVAGFGARRMGLAYNTGVGATKIAGAAYFELDATTDTTSGCSVAAHDGIESGSGSAVFVPASTSNELAVASPLMGLDDQQANSSSMSIDSNGRLTRFSGFAPSGNHAIGTAKVGELAGNALATIGRWNGGTTTTPIAGAGSVTLDGWDGVHYAIGTPAPMSAIGAGKTVTYTLSSATRPTSITGGLEPGTLTSATVTIDTTLQSNTRGTFSIDLAGTIGGSPFMLSIPSGQSSYTYNGTSTITFYGSNVRGAVVGPNAEHVVLSYSTGTSGIQGALLLNRNAQ